MTHAKTPCVVLASRLGPPAYDRVLDVKRKMLMVAERVPPSKQPLAFSKAKHTNTRVNNINNNPATQTRSHGHRPRPERARTSSRPAGLADTGFSVRSFIM